jgi:hypothetical protein
MRVIAANITITYSFNNKILSFLPKKQQKEKFLKLENGKTYTNQKLIISNTFQNFGRKKRFNSTL